MIARFQRAWWLVCAVALLTAASAFAQNDPGTAANSRPRKGRVLLPERPTAHDANLTAASNIRPVRPERPELPPPVQVRIEQFRLESNQYLAEQQALLKQLEGANDRDRELIRRQRDALREKWLERARLLREEWKERQDALADKLPSHRELLDSLRNDRREELRETQQENRTRRGTD